MVESRTQKIVFADESDAYCKYAWRNIDWEPVLEFLEIRLDLLMMSAINYWSECQVKDMRDMIQKLVDSDEGLLWNDERREEAGPLRHAATELLIWFNFYVENEARLLIC